MITSDTVIGLGYQSNLLYDKYLMFIEMHKDNSAQCKPKTSTDHTVTSNTHTYIYILIYS